jgi:hypothetical protein
MAGLKKSSKKDAGNPNTALVIALIFFIVLSIGLGVFAYFGYDGQENLRNQARIAKKDKQTVEEQRNNYALVAIEALIAEGHDLDPAQKSTYLDVKNLLISSPDKFNEIKKPIIDAFFAEHAANLKGYNANDAKYESNYKAELKRANEEAKAAQTKLDALQKEYTTFKSNYDAFLAKYEKGGQTMNENIQQGNRDALEAALKTNAKFPELQKMVEKWEDDRKKQSDDFNDETQKLLGRIARLNIQITDLEKRLNDRATGTAVGPQGGTGDLHALMLDISRGLPLWDRPLGKVLRVDATNLLVTIDMGAKAGVHPDVSFNVFGSGPGGRADKQLKGTLEVVRVVNEVTSICRITSLYDATGESIPLERESLRSRAIRASDDILREGDLLFNTFFDAHVFIAGSVNFTGYASDSPAAQNLQLQEFMTQLRKQGVAVDGYINLLNGQVEGAITPRTRLLVRGNIAKLNSTEDEATRLRQITEAYQVLKKQAVDQGMFIISAENFAAVTGYRSPQAQSNGLAATFRPTLPWTGGNSIQRFDRNVEGAGAAPIPIAPMPPMADEKKDAEK